MSSLFLFFSVLSLMVLRYFAFPGYPSVLLPETLVGFCTFSSSLVSSIASLHPTESPVRRRVGSTHTYTLFSSIPLYLCFHVLDLCYLFFVFCMFVVNVVTSIFRFWGVYEGNRTVCDIVGDDGHNTRSVGTVQVELWICPSEKIDFTLLPLLFSHCEGSIIVHLFKNTFRRRVRPLSLH